MLIPAAPEGLCLDFANTRFWRGSGAPTESLHGMADLLAWLGKSAGVPGGAVDGATAWAAADPAAAGAAFAAAVELREAIYRVFGAIAAGRPVDPADFTPLGAALAAAPARGRLEPADGGYAWRVAPAEPPLPGLLAPVLWSAADLLLAAGSRRIRRCANDDCLWLFVDTSKSGTRRWCFMSSCGNRAKAHRHYARSKGR